METGKGPVIGKSIEFIAVKKDGTKFPIEVSISAMELNDGKRGAAGIIRDLSFKRRIQEDHERLSYFDALTGIANRNLYEEIFKREWISAVRNSESLSMVMCKILNLEELKEKAQLPEIYYFLTKITNSLNTKLNRPNDIVARYEVDLLLILLPDTKKKQALHLLKILDESVHKVMQDEEGREIKAKSDLRISWGAATVKPDQESSPDALFSACKNNLDKKNKKDVNNFDIAEVRDNVLKILHISDLHIISDSQAEILRGQLRDDLKRRLRHNRLDFLVISGDIANSSKPEEYEAAIHLTKRIQIDFNLGASHIVVVPGNHDVNWELSKKAYKFVDPKDIPSSKPQGKYVATGDKGFLVRDDEVHHEKYSHFSKKFYEKITDQKYPSCPKKQAIIYHYEKEKIVFLRAKF